MRDHDLIFDRRPLMLAEWTPLLGQFFRFLVVGGISAGTWIACNVLLTTTFGLRPGVAVLLSTVLLTPAAYLAHRTVTFRSRNTHRAAFPRYVGTQALGNVIGVVMSESLHFYVAAAPWLAFTLVAGVVAVSNFICHKVWTFSLRA